MSKAVVIHNTGNPDVIRWENIELGAPGPGELRIRHTAVGLNYIDIYHRQGTYPLNLPARLGVEGVGLVEMVGDDVQGFNPGDRVVYAGGTPGAYATERLLPAARAVKLPETISDELAASVFFKGLTVEYLIRRCYKVQKNDVVLWHAAAGGVGSIASQWLSHIGATVIGIVGSAEKVEKSILNGCKYTINHNEENIVARVNDITNGRLVSVVYDCVGKDTLDASINCLRPRGTLVSFGTMSGPTQSLELATLGSRGSLYVTRASIAHYTAERSEYEDSAQALFNALKEGFIKADVPTIYPLQEVVQAHQALESSKTTGSVILIP